MKKIIVSLLAIFLGYGLFFGAIGFCDDFHFKILYPTVRIRSGNVQGSGIIFASIKNKSRYDTYVLTNHHVIRESIAIREEWNSLKKKMEKKETRATIEVEQFKYQNMSINTGTLLMLADIVEWNKDQDLALIRLRSDEYILPVKPLPKKKIDELRIFQQIVVCGAGNGRSPFPTFGIIASLQDEIDNYLYWMVTAPSIFGNSGGGTFLHNTQEFIGMPAKLTVIWVGWSPNAVYHMNYIIPILRIYEWLESAGWAFIYDPNAISRDEWVKEKGKKDKE